MLSPALASGPITLVGRETCFRSGFGFVFVFYNLNTPIYVPQGTQGTTLLWCYGETAPNELKHFPLCAVAAAMASFAWCNQSVVAACPFHPSALQAMLVVGFFESSSKGQAGGKAIGLPCQADNVTRLEIWVVVVTQQKSFVRNLR